MSELIRNKEFLKECSHCGMKSKLPYSPLLPVDIYDLCSNCNVWNIHRVREKKEADDGND